MIAWSVPGARQGMHPESQASLAAATQDLRTQEEVVQDGATWLRPWLAMGWSQCIWSRPDLGGPLVTLRKSV